MHGPDLCVRVLVPVRVCARVFVCFLYELAVLAIHRPDLGVCVVCVCVFAYTWLCM